MNATETAEPINLTEMSRQEKVDLFHLLLRDLIGNDECTRQFALTYDNQQPLGFFIPAGGLRKPPFLSLEEWSQMVNREPDWKNSMTFEELNASINWSEDPRILRSEVAEADRQLSFAST